MDPQASKSRWFRKVTLWLPTWRVWICLLVILCGLLSGAVLSANRFLSMSRPVEANVLVVEGWLPDYALQEAVNEFRNGHYQYLVASGGPIEKGHFITGYDTYAAIAAATLRKLGFPNDRLIEAPAAKTFRNRTFESAKRVRTKLNDLGLNLQGLNVVSEGPHARRTWMVYRKVFGQMTEVGVIAVTPQNYDPERWWASNEGLKSTLTEGLGWAYELLLNSGR